MIPKGWRDWAFEAAEREKAKWPVLMHPDVLRRNHALFLREAEAEARFHEWAREERRKAAEAAFVLIGDYR